ncbi:MAG: glycosyl hydrolase [Verrucomicrobiota bacterium]
MKMILKQVILAISVIMLVILQSCNMTAQTLEQSFRDPPDSAKCWVYWWWMHGWIDEAGIRADLDHMQEVGISGALVFQAGGGKTPFKTEFLSERWQELFRYAVEQAALRDIEIGLNLCDGWNAGGPWISEEFGVVGYTPKYQKTTMGAQRGREVDPYHAKAMDLHWKHTVENILSNAGEAWCEQYVGSTFKYTHIDSWERGYPTESPVLADEFLKRRQYPLGSESGERYDEDFHRTLTEIWAENYYQRLSELSNARGLQTHSEAGGWEYSKLLDALRYVGEQDIAMCEYWSRPTRGFTGKLRQVSYPRGGKKFPSEYPLEYHDHVKTTASAAHIYGKQIVQAEAYTLWAPGGGYDNFTMTFWEMKDIGDRAFCQGLNRNVFHHMIAQAGEGLKPGYVWTNVGFDYLRTNSLWPMGRAALMYKSRVQHLLQQGHYVADFLYFHGNHVPVTMPSSVFLSPKLPEGTQADLVNAHALLTRAQARDGRIVFPDGQSYAYLVLCKSALKTLYAEAPVDPTDALSTVVMEKLHALVDGGVTLIGPPPSRSFGVVVDPESEAQFERIRTALWGDAPAESGNRTVGAGRVIWGHSLEKVAAMDALSPDLEIVEDAATKALPDTVKTEQFGPGFDYIHRTIDELDVYFVANLRQVGAGGKFTFRDSQAPQIWDPVTGEVYNVSKYEKVDGGRVALNLAFEPRQSLFVVFGNAELSHPEYHYNQFRFTETVEGPWEVAFDPTWGGPESITFPELIDWTTHSKNGIKYYSGTARYKTTFELPAYLEETDRPVYLNLGTVKEMAEVSVNGESLGIVWTAPFQIDISSALKSGANTLEIDVCNVFSNRMVGDKLLGENYTTTNSKVGDQLYPSGLLGPVKLGLPEKP